MKRLSSYNTKQGEAINEYIVSLKNTHVTAAQIVSHFENREIPVGRTTIYRHLDKLIKEGKLRKYSVDGIIGACYQYVDDSEELQCLLLKCENCGELIHSDCDVLQKIHQHIFKAHTFRVNTTKTVFYGKCEACSNDT